MRPARPRPHPLADLAALLDVPAPATPVLVTGVTHSSTSVVPGDLYVALHGLRTHGAKYAADAVAAGAVAVLTDHAGRALAESTGVPVLVVDTPRSVLGQAAAWVYDDPTAGMTLLGVTGTNGKTTTAHLLEAGLRAAGQVTGLVGTVETRIAGETVPSVRTTPEATDLQAAFAAMRERGVGAVAMEVSSHALAYGRVDAVRFTTGIFTNLSQDHLDFHASMEEYFAAKAMLFDGRCAHEVVNPDDPWGRRLVRSATVTASAAGDPDATWRALDLRAGADGTARFRAVGPGAREVPVRIRIPGTFNVSNALLALAALDTVGADLVEAARGMATCDVPGRMERVDEGQPFLAVVDYAHTPDAVATALAALRPLTRGRLVVVLGCGGDRDRAKRSLMGDAAGRGADLVVVTDDNPRSEDPDAIRSAMVEGLRATSTRWVEVGDRRAAVELAVREAGPGDTVLVAGKGHEQGQEVAGTVHPFDDRTVLREAIATVAP